MPRVVKPRSRVEGLHARLQTEILHGSFVPGQRLRLADLAAQHGVSLTVVREAVTRLAAEGMLEAVPQFGFRVRPFDLVHLRELTWVRSEIEPLAVRESVTRGDTAWEAALVGAHHALTVTPILGADGGPSTDWIDCHRSFHVALCSACPNQVLLQIREQLFDAAAIYRFVSGGLVHPPKSPQSHRQLLEAALERNADEAARLVVEHLRATAARVERAAAAAAD